MFFHPMWEEVTSKLHNYFQHFHTPIPFIMTNHRIIHHHHNHHLLPPHTTARSTTTIQACAACRYQRRKCAPDCILAPYFPHDRQRQFQNAHKLFGVSNITKIIRHLDPFQKDEAMRTIIYQSDVRALDPVGGCYRIIRELQRQIDVSNSDLEIVLQQLAFCRTLSVHNQNQNHTNLNHDEIVIDDEVNCDINLVSSSNDPRFSDDPVTGTGDDVHRRRLDQIVIDDEVNCDINLVSSSEDLRFSDDPVTGAVAGAGDEHQRRGLDLDLDLWNISLQGECEDDDGFVIGKKDLKEEDGGWVALIPLNDESSSSPPSAAGGGFEVKHQTLLHASVCDEFKSLLLDDININPPVDHGIREFKFEFRNSVENLFSEENHKVIIKEEDEEQNDATLSTIKDCKAT